MPAEVVVRSLRHVWKTLQPLKLPMAVVGGLALATWKYVRAARNGSKQRYQEPVSPFPVMAETAPDTCSPPGNRVSCLIERLNVAYRYKAGVWHAS